MSERISAPRAGHTPECASQTYEMREGLPVRDYCDCKPNPAPDDVTLPEGVEVALKRIGKRYDMTLSPDEERAGYEAVIRAALERVNDRVARYKDANEHLKNRAMTAERRADAADALLNTYNLGGWTDAEGPMRRALAAEARVRELEAELNRLTIPQPIDAWGEDVGAVLWWHSEHGEPPYAGTPLDSDWPSFHTHWTRCPNPRFDIAARQAGEVEND